MNSYTAAGRFSAPLHFIDANDSPPESCGVVFDRDCGEACIIGAIGNYVSARREEEMKGKGGGIEADEWNRRGS